MMRTDFSGLSDHHNSGNLYEDKISSGDDNDDDDDDDRPSGGGGGSGGGSSGGQNPDNPNPNVGGNNPSPVDEPVVNAPEPILDLHGEARRLFLELVQQGHMDNIDRMILDAMNRGGSDPFEFVNEATALEFIRQATMDEGSHPLLNPVADGYLSSPYNRDRPVVYDDEGRPLTGYGHYGADLAGPAGSSVTAALAGTVTFSGFRPGLGNFVQITSGDGTLTTYSHNQTNLVAVGQVVKIGQQISTLGSTGNSRGPHSHFTYQPTGDNYDKTAGVLPQILNRR